MAELPLLFLAKAISQDPARRGGGGASIKKPSAAEQRERLDHKFQTIANSFQDVQCSIEGAEPEQVIVLETIGEDVKGLAEAAKQVPGLEWLAEADLEEADPSDGFQDEEDATKKLPRRLYAVMSNQQAMSQLVALWKHWHEHPEERAKQKFGPFKNIFIHLKDIRRWSVKDRIQDTCVVKYWRESLEYEKGNIRFEVELWCRGDEEKRQAAFETLKQIIEAAGGQCISTWTVPDVHYYGVLAELPASEIQEAIDQILAESDTQLLRCEHVMFFRPHAQAILPGHGPDEKEGEVAAQKPAKAKVAGTPFIALLDGLPLENHNLLKGRLVIDDADDHSSQYKPNQQGHGTAMASVILHGDLSINSAPLSRPLFVRPIMIGMNDLSDNPGEKTPDDRLLVDLVHRAIVAIKGTDNKKGLAPDVKVINFSIGNNWQPFYRQLSPLARLLDWLAWKYKLLFIVSAGNQLQSIHLPHEAEALTDLEDDALNCATLAAIHKDQVDRRPLSPAEAINVLTVGALHADGAAFSGGDRRVDLLRGVCLPSPINPVASGFNRSVKPDVLFPGGRALYLQKFSAKPPYCYDLASSTRAPGICVAAPGDRPMELGKTVHSRGTSNATALGSRTAGLIHERLLSLKSQPGGDRSLDDHVAVVLKALIAHGASWGEAGETLERLFKDVTTDWRELQRLKTRFLGYGAVDTDRAMFSTDKRVLLLGWDSLEDGKAHEYGVPLPPSLSAQRVKRRLTVSLAWLSPLNPRHKEYRKAEMWFSFDKDLLALEKKDLDFDGSKRGTIQHQIFEGEKARAFSDGDELKIKVNCSKDAGKLTETIPYALAVTLEIADPLGLAIYQEIRDRVHAKIKISAQGA